MSAVSYYTYSKKKKVTRALVYLFMILLLVFTLLPLIYVVTTAFKPLYELLKFPPQFFVRRPTLDNFSSLLIAFGTSSVPFLRYLFNSVLTSVLATVLTVIVSAMGCYGMVKHKLPFSGALFMLIISALMFSPQVTQISTYLVVNQLGMVNTYWALIVPKIAVAFNFFLLKQFLEQMPDAFLEAARIDGGNEWTIFWKITMPFLGPAWATLIVFTFVSNWNDYFSALIYISDQALKTLPLALQSIGEGTNLARAGAVAAATFIMTLPTVIVFAAMQKKVINTMAFSGIK